MKTIRQIADEIGVSKQAVFKKIKREPLSTSLQGLTATVDGRLMVEVDGEKLIKQAFSEIAPSTTDNQLTGAVDGLVDAPSTKNEEKMAEVDGVISVLKATIDTLQGQLEVTSPADLAIGAYGIEEPTGALFTDYATIDLVIVPGVAFDRDGNRLGRGKGYYDRLLPRIPSAYKVGICFPFQIVEEVPAEPFDIRMDEIITQQ